jgi:hypothetical protein
MNDITIIDLFWLILKFLAALGLVILIGLVLYLVWAAIKRAGRVAWDIVRGGNASVTATVCFALGVVVWAAVFKVGYLHYHAPPQQNPSPPEQNLSSAVPDRRDLCNNPEHVITISAVREYAKKQGVGPNAAGIEVGEAGCRIVADPVP